MQKFKNSDNSQVRLQLCYVHIKRDLSVICTPLGGLVFG
jgi:hypothetical protein